MHEEEQLTYNKDMRILISNTILLIEVAPNRCIFGGLDGVRSPVMAESFFFASHFFSPYSEDHKPTPDDENIIRKAIAAKNLIRMPIPYEEYHLFTEEEYGKLSAEAKKDVAQLEKADGTVILDPYLAGIK